jgi:hypothetical protein
MAVGYYFVKPNAYTLALATGVRLAMCGNNNRSPTLRVVFARVLEL